jgi:hypothetical protein
MELLSVSDVAALLDEPEHVVSIACSRFATFVPMVRIGRDRWYPPEAIPVLRVIFDQIRVGVPDEHIETVLTKRFPVTRISSQDLAGQSEPAPAPPQAESRTNQVRDVFDRYQSAIQNEMLQMRREIAQMAPMPPPPAAPRPEYSLSELARQDSTANLNAQTQSKYVDPRGYGFTHAADQIQYEQPERIQVPPLRQPELTEPRATEADFEDGLSEDAKTILSAISRQAAASETASLRGEVENIRGELRMLLDQFRSFSQQLGVYQDVRERPRAAATGTHGPSASPVQQAPTKLEVVPQERDRDRERDTGYNAHFGSHLEPPTTASSNGLLGQLTKRSPRRMGRTLLGNEE